MFRSIKVGKILSAATFFNAVETLVAVLIAGILNRNLKQRLGYYKVLKESISEKAM